MNDRYKKPVLRSPRQNSPSKVPTEIKQWQTKHDEDNLNFSKVRTNRTKFSKLNPKTSKINANWKQIPWEHSATKSAGHALQTAKHEQVRLSALRPRCLPNWAGPSECNDRKNDDAREICNTLRFQPPGLKTSVTHAHHTTTVPKFWTENTGTTNLHSELGLPSFALIQWSLKKNINGHGPTRFLRTQTEGDRHTLSNTNFYQLLKVHNANFYKYILKATTFIWRKRTT